MNPECHIRRIDFPNRSVEAATFPNDDGSFDIYLNTLCSQAVQEAALRHELEHIRLDHFYTEDKDIRQKEREADGLCPVPDVESHPIFL
jgi:predicted metal-dependent peptidase